MNFKTPLAVVVAYDKQFAGGLSGLRRYISFVV